MERITLFRENCLIFCGIWGEAESILRIWEQRQITFRELGNLLSAIQVYQYIISKEQGSTDPLGASNEVVGGGRAHFHRSYSIELHKIIYFVCLI